MKHNKYETIELAGVSCTNYNEVLTCTAGTRNNTELLTIKNTMKGGVNEQNY